MQVVIPSAGRARQIASLEWCPSDTRLIVPTKEQREYSRTYPDYEVVPCPARGIAPTRQWIVDNTEDRYVFMVDDDLVFFERQPDLKLTRLGDPTRMWQAVEDQFLAGFPHVAISIRLGNNRVPTEFKDCTNVCDLWGVDRHVLHKHGIRLDRTPVMEDYQCVLSLLTLGYHTRVLYNWAANGKNARNAAGGCSTWRTAKVQEEGANLLKAMFPEFVTIVHKQTKTGWFEGERTDVRIAWKKAADSANYLR